VWFLGEDDGARTPKFFPAISGFANRERIGSSLTFSRGLATPSPAVAKSVLSVASRPESSAVRSWMSDRIRIFLGLDPIPPVGPCSSFRPPKKNHFTGNIPLPPPSPPSNLFLKNRSATLHLRISLPTSCYFFQAFGSPAFYSPHTAEFSSPLFPLINKRWPPDTQMAKPLRGQEEFL